MPEWDEAKNAVVLNGEVITVEGINSKADCE